MRLETVPHCWVVPSMAKVPISRSVALGWHHRRRSEVSIGLDLSSPSNVGRDFLFRRLRAQTSFCSTPLHRPSNTEHAPASRDDRPNLEAHLLTTHEQMLLESLVVIAFVILLAYFLKRNRSEEEMPLIIEDSRVEDPRKTSKAVVLHSKSGPYTVVHDWPRPRIGPKELLIKVHAIGLNPIDWKCVAYGFGIHSTPWISGRETAGVVEEVGLEVPDFRKGDRVFVTSTNYRDIRTSTFQEVNSYLSNAFRIEVVRKLTRVLSTLQHSHSTWADCRNGFLSKKVQLLESVLWRRRQHCLTAWKFPARPFDDRILHGY